MVLLLPRYCLTNSLLLLDCFLSEIFSSSASGACFSLGKYLLATLLPLQTARTFFGGRSLCSSMAKRNCFKFRVRLPTTPGGKTILPMNGLLPFCRCAAESRASFGHFKNNCLSSFSFCFRTSRQRFKNFSISLLFLNCWVNCDNAFNDRHSCSSPPCWNSGRVLMTLISFMLNCCLMTPSSMNRRTNSCSLSIQTMLCFPDGSLTTT